MARATKSTAAKKTASSDLPDLSLLSRYRAQRPKALVLNRSWQDSAVNNRAAAARREQLDGCCLFGHAATWGGTRYTEAVFQHFV